MLQLSSANLIGDWNKEAPIAGATDDEEFRVYTKGAARQESNLCFFSRIPCSLLISP